MDAGAELERARQAHVVADLLAALPADRVLLESDGMAPYLRDEAMWAEHGQPRAVVRARGTDDVAAAVAICARHRVPVVARGAGTGLAGGANAVDGGVVVSTELMREIVEIDVGERLAVVQPGVVNDDLRAAVAGHGLWYPPDPSSAPWSTIGGNVATNAGGLCSVKYGVTRDYVLALEVVTAAGGIVRLGRRTAKGVAGYDLVALMVGSEGTLGVITEITVRLRRNGRRHHARSSDPSTPSARAAAPSPESLHADDSGHLRVDRPPLPPCGERVEERRPARRRRAAARPVRPTRARGRARGRGHPRRVPGAGARDAVMSSDPVEADALFAARRLVYPALVQRGDDLLIEDVCLPRQRLTEMITRVDAVGAWHDVLIVTAAHAGDGNLHAVLVTPPGGEVPGGGRRQRSTRTSAPRSTSAEP